jgi:dihydrofolate synthase/folylpolyglutamate synthase
VAKADTEYASVLEWLQGLEAARGMDFKLERVALALERLGNPHRCYATIHVAGTNGKGSVAAMLHAMFSSGGYRVGLYTSPHLVSFAERIRIGDESIAPGEVVELVREVRAVATERGIDLTFFEFVTVAAFLHFARRGVMLAVVEVGLGGRLDATNVVEPDVAVITTIGMDHEEYLGDSIEAVAREKGGIIKRRRPVVIGRVPAAAAAVLRDLATRASAPARWLDIDFWVEGTDPFCFQSGASRLSEVHLSLRGAYQRDNAAVALAAADLLRARFPLDDAAIRHALATVRWPGRLEVAATAPLVLLDGAHNVDGTAALVRELPAVVADRPLHLLFAVMRDKRWRPMVDAVGPHVASAVVTTVLPPRGESPEALAAAFRPYCPVQMAYEPEQGLDLLLRSVGPDAAILVTGSLFLIGAVHPLLSNRGVREMRKEPTDAPPYP